MNRKEKVSCKKTGKVNRKERLAVKRQDRWTEMKDKCEKGKKDEQKIMINRKKDIKVGPKKKEKWEEREVRWTERKINGNTGKKDWQRRKKKINIKIINLGSYR